MGTSQSQTIRMSGSNDLECTLSTHSGLKGSRKFHTSQVVGDMIVGLPWYAGKILLFNPQSRQLDFVEDARLKGEDMFWTSQVIGDMIVGLPQSAGKILLFNPQSRQLDFVEDDRLKGEYMFCTSQVVGDMIVGLPQSAGKILLFNPQSRQLDFVEDAQLKEEELFMTSQVVGGMIVGLPYSYSAAMVVIIDGSMRITFTAFFGNPGKGKSALANCACGEAVFESGPSMGDGLTTKIAKTHGIIDTPGLADVDRSRRKNAATQITAMLKSGGSYKFIFVITLQHGRILEEDKTTIKIVLDAAGEIGRNYGIVINQCAPWVMNMRGKVSWKSEFESRLFDKLPFATSHLCYLPQDAELDHAFNRVSKKLASALRSFLDEVPIVKLSRGRCKEILADDFYSIMEKLKVSREEALRQGRLLKAMEEFHSQPAEVSRRLGISLNWILNDFVHAKPFHGMAQQEVLSKNFWELSPIAAHGDRAFGKGKSCPRDGQLDCSIVDAVRDEGHSDAATIFVSWVWQIPLSTVLSSLQKWQLARDVAVLECFIWWCFYQNNQFRFGRVHSPDELAFIFGGQLRQIGRMLCMLNKIEGPIYLTRIWCVFELFVARKENIPIEIALPEDAEDEVNDIVRGGLPRLRNAMVVNAAGAKATAPQDEIDIKAKIEKESSYNEVNEYARIALQTRLQEILFPPQ